VVVGQEKAGYIGRLSGIDRRARNGVCGAPQGRAPASYPDELHELAASSGDEPLGHDAAAEGL